MELCFPSPLAPTLARGLTITPCGADPGSSSGCASAAVVMESSSKSGSPKHGRVTMRERHPSGEEVPLPFRLARGGPSMSINPIRRVLPPPNERTLSRWIYFQGSQSVKYIFSVDESANYITMSSESPKNTRRIGQPAMQPQPRRCACIRNRLQPIPFGTVMPSNTRRRVRSDEAK
jgi:hypothetical protein